MISTASAQLMPLFPDPLYSGTIKNTPRFSGCCPFLNRNAYTVKIDHVLSANNKLSFFFSEVYTGSQYSNTTGGADGLPEPITQAIGTFIIRPNPALLQ